MSLAASSLSMPNDCEGCLVSAWEPSLKEDDMEVEFDENEIGYQVVFDDPVPEPEGRDEIEPFTMLPVETTLLKIASRVFLLIIT